ncbi:hypothetical protein [Mesorhizobium sp. A623]
MTTYASENKIGRQRAVQLIEDCAATGDMPRLVRLVREMAADKTGYGVGFLYALGEMAMAGRG